MWQMYKLWWLKPRIHLYTSVHVLDRVSGFTQQTNSDNSANLRLATRRRESNDYSVCVSVWFRSGSKLYRLVGVSFGLLCIVQAALNISLYLVPVSHLKQYLNFCPVFPQTFLKLTFLEDQKVDVGLNNYKYKIWQSLYLSVYHCICVFIIAYKFVETLFRHCGEVYNLK